MYKYKDRVWVVHAYWGGKYCEKGSTAKFLGTLIKKLEKIVKKNESNFTPFYILYKMYSQQLITRIRAGTCTPSEMAAYMTQCLLDLSHAVDINTCLAQEDEHLHVFYDEDDIGEDVLSVIKECIDDRDDSDELYRSKLLSTMYKNGIIEIMSAYSPFSLLLYMCGMKSDDTLEFQRLLKINKDESTIVKK